MRGIAGRQPLLPRWLALSAFEVGKEGVVQVCQCRNYEERRNAAFASLRVW